MKSFDKKYLAALTIPHYLITIIRQIGEYKSKQELYKKQAPEKLETLRHVVIIQNTDSSNRLESMSYVSVVIRHVLKKLKKDSRISSLSKGPFARWRMVKQVIRF